MGKISKSVQIQKGKKIGYEQFAELLRAFNEKTGVIDSDGTVKEVFKIVIEIDESKIRGELTPEIENYKKFKDNTAVRTMNDPGDGIVESIKVEEELPAKPRTNGYFAFDEEVDGPVDQEEIEVVVVKPKKKTTNKKK
jgi:hypothetical protein